MSADALRNVRVRIASGWSQEADARDALGQEVPLAGEQAVEWTLSSAVALAGKDGIPMNHLPAALRALRAGMYKARRMGTWPCLERWAGPWTLLPDWCWLGVRPA